MPSDLSMTRHDVMDEAIVREIRKNPRAQLKTIAKALKNSPSTVSRRLARLGEEGVVYRFAELRRFYPLSALIDLKINSPELHDKVLKYHNQHEFVELLCRRLADSEYAKYLEHVVIHRAMIILGSVARDIQLEVYARDVATLTGLVTRCLHCLPGVEATQTNIIGHEITDVGR